MMKRDRRGSTNSETEQPLTDTIHNRVAAETVSMVVQAGHITGGIHHYVRSQLPIPRQLAAAPRYFVGRHDELAQLTADLAGTTTTGDTVLISALAGAGGIGKTALALHWAHQNLHRFPDGQLFVDLQGFSPAGEPVEPARAVRSFLDALGIPTDRIPSDLQAMATLYRSEIADKRMLIVLDNAVAADQVVPLLPGSPTCTVIVTSRRHLTGLVTRHGACHLQLGILSNAEAHQLLVSWLGIDRVAAEPAAVDKLLNCCGGFALALDIVAARAYMNPRASLAELAAELLDDTTRLNVLDNADRTASLPAVLSWSLRALTNDQIYVFALLGIAPGLDISLPAATCLTALQEGSTRSVLRDLENASLIQQHTPGQYRMHDLIRDYASDTARQQLAGDVQDAALRRVLDFYTHTAHSADRLLDPYRPPIRLDPPTPGVRLQSLPDVPAVMAWFDTEHATLLAAQHTAVGRAWHDRVWQLAWTLNAYHNRRGYHRDRLAVWQAALFAADHLPDPTTRIHAHRLIGHAYAELGCHEDGIGHLDLALALAEEHPDTLQQANTHRRLAMAWGFRGNDRRALEHATHARDLFRTINEPVLEALALDQVGLHAARLGQSDIAYEHCQAALALHRRHHYPVGEAVALDSLGYISHQSGHRRQAAGYYQQALAVFRALDNTYASADTLHRLGSLHVALGEHEQARVVWREALRLYQKQGRENDAGLVQQQLKNLDQPCDTAQLNK